MWFRVGRAGTCTSFAVQNSFCPQGQKQSQQLPPVTGFQERNKCRMVEICTEVRGIWAFVECDGFLLAY